MVEKVVISHTQLKTTKPNQTKTKNWKQSAEQTSKGSFLFSYFT